MGVRSNPLTMKTRFQALVTSLAIATVIIFVAAAGCCCSTTSSMTSTPTQTPAITQTAAMIPLVSTPDATVSAKSPATTRPTSMVTSRQTTMPTTRITTVPTTRPTTRPTTQAISCICDRDAYNCDDTEAQTCFDVCMARGAGDIHGLDGDDDGYACNGAK